MSSKLKVAVLGATGYSGLELTRILLRHPRVEKPVLLRRSENPHPTKSALGGAPSSVVAHASNGKSEWHQPTSLGALTPLFGSKHTGLFPADQRSFLVSFASHAALIELIASGIFVGNVTIVKRTFLTSEITFPAAGHGGGGSGDRSAIQATKGTPPKFSERQVTPPVIVVQNEKPRLPVESKYVFKFSYCCGPRSGIASGSSGASFANASD